MYFSKAFYDENGTPIEIELLCDRCSKIIAINKNLSITFTSIRPEYCVLNDNKTIKCDCGNVSNNRLIKQKEDTQMIKVKSTPSQPINNFKVECPYCHSSNVKKISGLSKAGNVALWGIFAIGKVGKQWHCNNCKSDF